MKNSSKYLVILFVLIDQFSFSQEEVKKHPILTDKFVFVGGVFFPDKSLRFSLNGKLIGDKIEFGKSFDIINYQSTMDLGFQWRFAKKWKLEADFFNINNVANASLDEPLEWGDYKFDASAEFGARIGVLRSIVGRTLSQGPKHEFGVGLGVHGMLIELYLEGEASLIDDDDDDDDGISTDFQTVSTKATTPLPNIGIWYYWTPTSRWALTADIDWMYIAFGNYKGGLWDVKGGVQFQVIKFFGVGVNYKYFELDLEVNQGGDIGDWRGNAKVTFNGPMVMVNFNF
jgi:hypothetical protein